MIKGFYYLKKKLFQRWLTSIFTQTGHQFFKFKVTTNIIICFSKICKFNDKHCKIVLFKKKKLEKKRRKKRMRPQKKMRKGTTNRYFFYLALFIVNVGHEKLSLSNQQILFFLAGVRRWESVRRQRFGHQLLYSVSSVRIIGNCINYLVNPLCVET